MRERIDHVAEAMASESDTAQTRATFAHETNDGVNVRTAIDELKHATLALVEQQRIANLIALANMDDGDPRTETPLAAATAWEALADVESDLRPGISAALGINEGARDE